MKITELEIRQFRNILHLELTPHPVLNCFVGDNAQGKTSLIEAAFFLSTLRSFRQGGSADLIMTGTEGASLRASVVDDNQEQHTDLRAKLLFTTHMTGASHLSSRTRRELLVAGKSSTAARFTSHLRTVVFSPESLASIKYGPDLRRDLVDEAVFQLWPEGGEAQSAFQRCLRQRNACLKQMKAETLDLTRGRGILESLNPIYLNLASEVIYHRLQFLENLMPSLREAFWQITHVGNSLEFLYQSSDESWTQRSITEVRERLEKELLAPERARAEEAIGTTLTGPHRHDLSFLVDGNDSRIYCSQGQQRALILAFKIAEIVYHKQVFGSFPLLLLDDVLSEFDEKKRRYLTDFLRQNEAQTFLTTTEVIPRTESSALFRVHGGQITRQKDGNGDKHRDQGQELLS